MHTWTLVYVLPQHLQYVYVTLLCAKCVHNLCVRNAFMYEICVRKLCVCRQILELKLN